MIGVGVSLTLPTISVGASASNWILATGSWADAGVWDDAASWTD
jgi:hypothetical protein